MGITQICSTQHNFRNICNARSNVLVCAWIAAAQITCLLCCPVIVWHFCIATIHLPQKIRTCDPHARWEAHFQNTSKTRQTQHTTKSTKVKKYLKCSENQFMAFPLGRGQKSWNVHPHRRPKANKQWTPCCTGITVLVFSPPLMRNHFFWKRCVARMGA